MQSLPLRECSNPDCRAIFRPNSHNNRFCAKGCRKSQQQDYRQLVEQRRTKNRTPIKTREDVNNLGRALFNLLEGKPVPKGWRRALYVVAGEWMDR